MAARPGLEDAAKAGLMKAELLLDRFGSQTDPPADLPLSCRTTAVDQRQLDAVSLVQAQPVEIGGWALLFIRFSRRKVPPQARARSRSPVGHSVLHEVAYVSKRQKQVRHIFGIDQACSSDYE